MPRRAFCFVVPQHSHIKNTYILRWIAPRIVWGTVTTWNCLLISVEKQNTLGSYSRNSQISASSKVFHMSLSVDMLLSIQKIDTLNTHHFVISSPICRFFNHNGVLCRDPPVSGVYTAQGWGWWKVYDPWESPFKRQGCFAKFADHQQCMRNLQNHCKTVSFVHGKWI